MARRGGMQDSPVLPSAWIHRPACAASLSLSLSLSIFKGMPGLKEVGEGNRRCRSEAKRSWRASYQELVESINIDNYMGFSKGK